MRSSSIGRGASVPPHYVARGTIAFDSERPADETALWRAYSLTKPVTGILTMILVGEGKLTLDTPVSEFIPGFARTRVLTSPETSLDSVAGCNVMTVRHLLTHTAGLGYNLISKGPLLEELKRLGVMPRKLSRVADAPVNRAPDLASFADRLATLPLVAEPGTWWSYSVGLEIAGRVIEVVEGKPFDLAMKDKLFDPLGMTDSFFQVPAGRAGDLSTTYEIRDGKPAPFDPGATSTFLDRPDILSGGVGLVCSARDYDRFLAMLAGWGALDGVRLMPEETARLAMSDILPETVDRKSMLIPGGFGAGGRVSISRPRQGQLRLVRRRRHRRFGRSHSRSARRRLDPVHAEYRARLSPGGGRRGYCGRAGCGRDLASGRLRRLLAEDAAAAELMRVAKFLGDMLGERRSARPAFQPACLLIEPPDRAEPFVIAEPGLSDRGLQHRNRLVIDLERDGVGVAVLAAMGEREARRIGKAAGRAMDDLGNHRQRPHRPRADARHHQQLGEVGWPTVRRGGERAVQSADDHILGADVVMRRHDEMRQHRRLGRGRGLAIANQCRRLAGKAIGAEVAQQIELAAPRRFGARVGEVDDHALGATLDRAVRRLDETGHLVRQPVIAPCLAARIAHALLHHHPAAVVGDDEAVEIKLETVLHRCAVDLGDKPAGLAKCIAIESGAFADREQLAGCRPRMAAAAAADMQAELTRERGEPALQRADYAGGDAG